LFEKLLVFFSTFLATTIVLTVHDSLHLGLIKKQGFGFEEKFTRSVMYRVRFLCRVDEILFPCKFGFRKVEVSSKF